MGQGQLGPKALKGLMFRLQTLTFFLILGAEGHS